MIGLISDLLTSFNFEQSDWSECYNHDRKFIKLDTCTCTCTYACIAMFVTTTFHNAILHKF